MADYSELLARLDIKQNALSDDAGDVLQGFLNDLLRDFVAALNKERAECAAAIRALIADRDAAVLAEREACAKVCDDKAASAATLIRGSGTRWREAVAAEAAALRLAAAIRARANG